MRVSILVCNERVISILCGTLDKVSRLPFGPLQIHCLVLLQAQGTGGQLRTVRLIMPVFIIGCSEEGCQMAQRTGQIPCKAP